MIYRHSSYPTKLKNCYILNPYYFQIPGLDNEMVDSEYNWKYVSKNNGAIDQAIINGSIHLSTGKMFGGSSSLNEMHYIRGHDQDFQDWFDEGNVDWSLDNVKRCFKKAESLQSKKMLKDPTISKYYGNEGPLVINRFNSTFRDITNGILKSWHEIGFKYVPDLNTAGLFGSGIVTATASDGVRQSTNTAYLVPIRNRRNIKILKHAFVRKILITEDSKVAFGVEVQKNGKILSFYSTHEVILSAGAVNSPHLLMLSGIGPKGHLRSKNITCLHDSPMVGQNLQDHLHIPITIYGDALQEETMNAKHRGVVNYILDRTGRLAESSMFKDISAFYSTQKGGLYPECQLYLSIIPKNTIQLRQYLTSQYRYKDSIVDSIAELNKNYTLYFFTFNLLHPYSTGNVSLKSNNPNDSPLIFTNYFDDPRDLVTAIKGLKMASKVVKSTFFKTIGGILGRMKWLPFDGLELDSEEYWECVCLNLVTSMHHLVGTCRMGPDPKTSVVDGRLRVHGVTHLRIIDASVMPKITSGNINGPSIMIGERGAEFIKEQYYEDL